MNEAGLLHHVLIWFELGAAGGRSIHPTGEHFNEELLQIVLK